MGKESLVNSGFYFLASPYSDRDPEIMERRYFAAMAACAKLIGDRINIYSPIVHFHEMAKLHVLPTDAGFWRLFNDNMLRRSDGLIVLKLPGWQGSDGVSYEREMAAREGLPIVDMEPV